MTLPDLLTTEEAESLLSGELEPQQVLGDLGLPPDQAEALHRDADIVLRELDGLGRSLTHPNAQKAAAQARRAVIQAREWEKHFARKTGSTDQRITDQRK